MQNYTERERCSEDGCNNIRRKRGTKCTRHCQSKETFEAYSFNLAGQDAIKTIESIKHMLSAEKVAQLERVKNAIL